MLYIHNIYFTHTYLSQYIYIYIVIDIIIVIFICWSPFIPSRNLMPHRQFIHIYIYIYIYICDTMKSVVRRVNSRKVIRYFYSLLKHDTKPCYQSF